MLSEKARNLLNYCEQSWMLEGVLPTPETLLEKFDYTPRGLNELLQSEDIKKSFAARGMPVIEGRDLTPEQITAANTILNLDDRRSKRKKLSDMGIDPKVWAGWLRNPSFKEYMRLRSEQILADSLPEANLALVDNISRGDLGSIKFFYEMTGRYNGTEKQIDLRVILERIFEVISTHVQDEETLMKIANDFKLLLALDKPGKVDVVQSPPALEL